MSEKRWLIRTTENQILGPVSDKKINDLLNEGALRSGDEVCQGNGYWFFLRESELVNLYIRKGETQNFNPISEALTVLANNNSKEQISTDENSSDENTAVIDISKLSDDT